MWLEQKEGDSRRDSNNKFILAQQQRQNCSVLGHKGPFTPDEERERLFSLFPCSFLSSLPRQIQHQFLLHERRRGQQPIIEIRTHQSRELGGKNATAHQFFAPDLPSLTVTSATGAERLRERERFFLIEGALLFDCCCSHRRHPIRFILHPVEVSMRISRFPPPHLL